ncbi:MAG TPA: hypothetical protein ENI64_02610 [Gammaproteobacteria bacterium]|nr:hypothetical protein [Gammaproteobacteria bacterium]
MTERRETSLQDKNLSDLYHQADKAEPAAGLDARIQAAAHAAVEGSPAAKQLNHETKAGSQQKQSWFALAAVVALVAIIVPIMQDESDLILSEPGLLLQSSDKLPEAEGDARSSVAEAGMAQPQIAPVAEPGSASAPAFSPSPEQGLLKARPEKKAYQERATSKPDALTIQEERLEHAARKSKQRAYNNQLAPAEAEKAVMPLSQSASMADQQAITAEVWQKQIRQLLLDKKYEKARTELQNLQKAWPDFQVDPNLLRQTGLLPATPAKIAP